MNYNGLIQLKQTQAVNLQVQALYPHPCQLCQLMKLPLNYQLLPKVVGVQFQLKHQVVMLNQMLVKIQQKPKMEMQDKMVKHTHPKKLLKL